MSDKDLTKTGVTQNRPLQSKQYSRKALKREKPVKYHIVNNKVDFDLDKMKEQDVYRSLVETTGCHSLYAANRLMSNMFQSVASFALEDSDICSNMAAMLHELDPQDGVEAMLCSNMVSVQHWIGVCGNKASNMENSPEVRDNFFAKMQKLMSQMTRQVEVLQKYRNKGQQTITVKQVQVNGGQNVIADNVVSNK